MKVKEFIQELSKYNPELEVIKPQFSEFVILDKEDIFISQHSFPRKDGWVAYRRPDSPSQEYLQLGSM